MPHMKNAPLIYTLGIVEFPRIPDFERFTEQFFDKVRKVYPFDLHIKTSNFQVEQTSEGLDFEVIKLDSWQYSSKDKQWAIILTEDTLCLHTAKYYDFDDFSQRFTYALESLLSIDDIGIETITNIGFRYLDLIVSTDNLSLHDFLQEWIIPPCPLQDKLTLLERSHSFEFETDIGNLFLQVLQNPSFAFAPDLVTPLILENEWISDKPNSDFAIIDTDHRLKIDEDMPINLAAIVDKLKQLKDVSEEVFDSFSTPKAKEEWAKE